MTSGSKATYEELESDIQHLKNIIQYYKRRDDLHCPIKVRPILYTDLINNEQCCRDDMWAISTKELNELYFKEVELRKEILRLNNQQAGDWLRMLAIVENGTGKELPKGSVIIDALAEYVKELEEIKKGLAACMNIKLKKDKP